MPSIPTKANVEGRLPGDEAALNTVRPSAESATPRIPVLSDGKHVEEATLCT